MPTRRRHLGTPWLLVVGWVVFVAGVAKVVGDAYALAACLDSDLMILCSGMPPDWFFVLGFTYALGLLYLTLRRWINGPTDEDQAD
jgi:hypothetical protein